MCIRDRLFAGEDGVAAVSIIMYLQFLCIGIYFGFSMGLSTPLGYAYGDRNFSVCRVLEKYAYRFFAIAPIILYGDVSKRQEYHHLQRLQLAVHPAVTEKKLLLCYLLIHSELPRSILDGKGFRV